MADEFLSEYLSKPDREKKELLRQAIENDRWDRRAFNELLEEMKEFRVEHNRMSEVIETAPELWADAFWAFWKIEPHMIPDPLAMDPKWIMDHVVMQEAQELSDYTRTKFYAEGDDVASAMATIALREDLETLWDKNKKFAEQQKQAEELQRLQQAMEELNQEERDLDELLSRWAEGFNPDTEEVPSLSPEEAEARKEELEQQQQELQQKIDAAAEALRDSIENVRPAIRAAMRDALEKAADEVEAINGASVEMWGQDPGHIRRLPADERIKLAKRLNNERFRRMHDVWGKMDRVMTTEQRRKVHQAMDEVVDVTLGRDLPRVLPREFALLQNPETSLLFYKAFIQHRLMQYEMEGEEPLGRGDLIVEIDTSGSMTGEKEICSKAVALCCLHLSRKQKRGFTGYHFGSAHELKRFAFGKGAIDLELLLSFAEEFRGGGTDFVRPLSAALDDLRKQYNETGETRGDIVFITDGLCGVPADWMEMWHREKKRLGFKCFGIIMGGLGRDSEPLKEICDGRVLTFADIVNDNAREIWRDM